jgi:TPR repeat protein
MPRHLRALERAAKRGDSFAQYNLGAHLASGEGVEQNLKRAMFWYRKAAAQKEPEAVYNLGLMHMTGEGVVVDVRRGMKMLERAAELGSPDAQQFLGEVLEAGLYGQKSDPERAAHYYLRSLADGYPRSALLLAIALERRGVSAVLS